MARRTPHDTEPVAWTATAWPTHDDWGEGLEAGRAEVAALAGALAGGGAGPTVGSKGPERAADPARARVLVPPRDEATGDAAAERLADAATADPATYADIWLRDTGPVFTLDENGPIAVAFAFNGWGGRFFMPEDQEVAAQIAERAGVRLERVDLVTEGGAIEVDGAGTAIITRASVLNRNRNPNLDAGDVERTFHDALGVERVIWLEEGLAHDHTDGHVDTLARFAAPGLVVCQAPAGPDDPNAAVLDDVARTLDRARDASDARLDVARIPSPGRVVGRDGVLRPASHMNYVHAAGQVITPLYDTPTAADALAGLREVFPDRPVVGLSARALVEEGGAFHCATVAAPHPDQRA